jgi:hypothetical protein
LLELEKQQDWRREERRKAKGEKREDNYEFPLLT